MRDYHDHLILSGSVIKSALAKLEELSTDAILFVTDQTGRLIGSLTDGDVRRGLLKGITIEQMVDTIIQPNPRFLRKGDHDLTEVIEYREKNLRIIPILDLDNKVVNIINFREIKSYLPVDAVIMAGGRGKRLSPLTDKIPKPLLEIDGKPIIEHNLERLTLYGVDDFWICLKYLGEQIEKWGGNGGNRNISIQYVYEKEPLGTIGAVALITNLCHEYILVTNSDILTNIDYEHFFLDFLKQGADFSVVTIPYAVDIPYAVLETNNGNVLNFREKPTYTYYSNGGIYLMKREVLNFIPPHKHFDATDLIEVLLKAGRKVSSYPLAGYWLDIGRPEDYLKAQKDINTINFK
ncbi:MAG: nucleotidyltransferase family protein [Bacteroidales bacterium]|nr:nucleotidyltransferase family protein [Bacteroidales bacterium]